MITKTKKMAEAVRPKVRKINKKRKEPKPKTDEADTRIEDVSLVPADNNVEKVEELDGNSSVNQTQPEASTTLTPAVDDDKNVQPDDHPKIDSSPEKQLISQPCEVLSKPIQLISQPCEAPSEPVAPDVGVEQRQPTSYPKVSEVEDPHSSIQRPQSLATLTSSLKTLSVNNAPEEFVTLSSDTGQHTQKVSGLLFSPDVIEDPDTPMSRTTSPNSPKPVAEAIKHSPTVPTLVLEEKSPSLLAQESLARRQFFNVESRAVQALPDQPDTQETLPSNLNCAALDAAEQSKTAVVVTQEPEENVQSPVENTKSVAQSSESSRVSYPRLELEKSKERSKAQVGPMPLSDVLALYYNPQLANNERFVDDFIKAENNKEQHEFHEILLSYFRARHQLTSVEEDIRTLQKKCASLLNDVWITHTKNVIVQGHCADQARVQTTHSYEQCQFVPVALSKIGVTLESIRQQISDNLALFAYTSQISKLQVESYIHNLYLSCPVLHDLPKNATIQSRQQSLASERHDIQRLKDCISILFMFHRKPTHDTEFVNSIRQWTIKLTSFLLRVGTFSDQLFILNHLLRCPAGVGKWAVELLQFPPLSCSPLQHQNSLGNPVIEHLVTALATILLPVKAREEFMCHMKLNITEQSIQEERAWILVDSDGEEDEDPSNSWLYLHENDIVSFLGQFPLADLFSSILLATISDTGSVDYDIRRSTEPMMIRLFSFTTVLIQLIGNGLATYSMARYRQLNKRLGRLIRQTISFVSDHWLNFRTYYGPLAPQASIENLQIEFDQLFMRATYSILTAQKLGSWQFMADMPYTCVSIDSMWQLLWVLHQGEGINLDMLPPVASCKSYLKGPDSWQQLADNLMHMPTSEAIYLLTTFANMAGCRSSEEEEFIRLITLEVFEIAYICNHTREFCSKVGRELLSSIIQIHPHAFSFLLGRVKEVMDKLGKMALYLFHELPICIWQPTDPDMLTLRQWLLNFDLNSSENQLAQVVLSKMNWDVFEESGRLVVDIRFHRQMALLLVEAYTKFIADKKAGFFITEGMKLMASYVTSVQSPEQKFNNWAWELALRLKLHQRSVVLHSSRAVDARFQPPVFGADAWLSPLQRATSNKTPIACFVAITMTNIGHDVATFISEGLDLLSVLTGSCQYTTAIHALGCIVPLYLDTQDYLLENNTFCQILQTLLMADESLIKSTKSTIMTVEFPGIVTKQLTEMIQASITSHLTLLKADQVIIFWLKAIFKVCKFFTDRNSCYVADTLIRWSFVKKGVLDIVTDIFKENYKKFCAAAKNRQSLVTSIFSWIANTNTLPSYMDSASLPEFPWLAYIILMVEGEQEVNSRLWQTLVMELHAHSRPNIEMALKAAVLKLQLDQAPSASRLTIFRWAQQALDTPFDHPLLPVLWQRFFGLFLGRQVFESSPAQRTSVGERFFENIYYTSMLKKMRKYLSDAAKFHLSFDPAQGGMKKRNSSQSSPGTPPGGDENFEFGSGTEQESMEYTSSKEFHQMLARLYQTYQLWLEEPRLHDGNLYLPALPVQYEAARLNQVFQGFMGPWYEFMDLEGVQYNLSCLAADWKKRLTSAKSAAVEAAVRKHSMNLAGNATERITRRLQRYETPKPPPPLQNIQSAVPMINSGIVDEKSLFLSLVRADLEILLQFTKIFSARLAHHCALDYNFTELLPSLYSNITKTIPITAECKSKVNPLHRCSGPAILPVTIEVKELNEIIQRRLDENRVEHKQVMIESLLPTAPNICVAVVHTENAITCLIKQSQTTTDAARAERLNDIGCTLFFYLVNLVSDETDFYPPSRQFLTSCIEILGQEFVSRDKSQTSTVLQLCLDKPSISGLVSPHFVPNSCPEKLVIMYGQLLNVLQSQNMELGFMLLTKFNIQQWLLLTPPAEAERKILIETLGSAILTCGTETKPETKLVFELYLSHLKTVLESNFPLNLYNVLHIILQGSASDQLHPQVWQLLLMSCFTSHLLYQDGGQRDSTDTFDGQLVDDCCDSPLHTAQVKELLDWLSSFFLHGRMNDSKNLTFGLYSHWSRYTVYISKLIGVLCRSYTTKIINGSEGMSTYQIVELIWHPVLVVFSPWLQPLMQTSGSLAMPWVDTDDTSAQYMVSAFCKCVLYIYQLMDRKFPNNGSGVLSLLLMYYMTGLSTKTTPAHIISVLVSEFKVLPWEELRPDLQLLETMTKMKEIAAPCCFSLLGQIVPQVQWPDVINYYMTQPNLEMASCMQENLAVLLIQCYVDTEHGEKPEMYNLLLTAEKYDWHLVTPEGFTRVCNWFLQLCDAKCVLAERSSRLALGIRLLKQISGFGPETPWSGQVSLKRQTYVHCIMQQLCHVTYMQGVSPDMLSTVLVNLLSDVEAMETAVPDVTSQEMESNNLLKEILSLLNNSNPEGQWLETIMSAFTGWLRSSPHSLLLVPCMKAASRSLASLKQMSAVIEAGIEVYFVGLDMSSTDLKGWPFILTVFQVPELNQAGYVQDSLAESAFLVLYAYLQHKLPFCQKLSDELLIMDEILEWSTKAQPSAVDESKLILWWHLLLRLFVRQVEFSPPPLTGTINKMSRFISYLNEVGLERTNKGILGALGLGQRSPLSQKMRLLAKTLSVFLASQIVSADTLRTNSASRQSSSSSCNELKALRKHKLYSQMASTIDSSITFIQDPNHTIHHVMTLFARVVKDLFVDKKYLCDVINLT
ncbi:ectopic P granules protein 5 homolog [Physella acuta]|uniref:ectopic P granules protein 5 homolog n=1 Tax=Physella acuta TaxID=109671 RepID=UPI0027DD5886|nr:ectopic P granules protein 5 homolog [Physella acuta]